MSNGAAPVLPPHPALPGYFDTADAKRPFLKDIFDAAAHEYDRLEAVLSLGSGRWYRRRCLRLAGLAPGMRVLDVAMGTGLVAREAKALAGDQGRVLGVDPSPGMLAQSRRVGVPATLGVAEALPVASEAFDVVSMGYALRHVPDLGAAFREMRRALVPGGEICVLEVSAPGATIGRLVLAAYFRLFLPTMAFLLRSSAESRRLWRYYWRTIDACVPPERVLGAIRDAGFLEVRRKVEFGVFSCYLARKPS